MSYKEGKSGNPATRFKPGQSGNPGGKPRRARNQLNASFLNALAEDFEKHGRNAIEACRIEDPAAYVKVVAGLLPKQIEDVTDKSDLDDMSDAELIDILRGRNTPQETDGPIEPTDVH